MNDPDGSAWLAIITDLQRDAARWRWLRACNGWPDVDVAGYSPAEFDALADRLRAERPATTGLKASFLSSRT